MYEHNDRSTAEYPQTDRADDGPRPSTKPVLRIRHYGTQFGWRHVKRVAVIRSLVAVWLVILGSVFCGFGQWWGALLYLGAGLNGWLAYQMPRWKLALDTERAGRLG